MSKYNNKNLNNNDKDFIEELNKERNSLNQVLVLMQTLTENGGKVKELSALDKQLNNLEKTDNRAKPWYKQLVQGVFDLKYIFVKHENKISQPLIGKNREIFKEIDGLLLNSASKSKILTNTLSEEIAKNINRLKNKRDLTLEQSEKLTNLCESYIKWHQKNGPNVIPRYFEAASLNPLANQANNINLLKETINQFATKNNYLIELAKLAKDAKQLNAEVIPTFKERISEVLKPLTSLFSTPKPEVKDLIKGVESNTENYSKIADKLDKIKSNYSAEIKNEETKIGERIRNLEGKVNSGQLNELKENYQKARANELAGHTNNPTTQKFEQETFRNAANQRLSEQSQIPNNKEPAVNNTQRPSDAREVNTLPPLPLPPLPESSMVGRLQSLNLRGKGVPDILSTPNLGQADRDDSSLPPPPPPPITTLSPPPPPPLPLIITPSHPTVNIAATQQDRQTTPKVPQDDRSNLLAQIQQGKQLKKLEQPEDKKQGVQAQGVQAQGVQAEGGMADAILKAMNKRRGGIAGLDSDSGLESSNSSWDSNSASTSSSNKWSKEVKERKPSSQGRVP